MTPSESKRSGQKLSGLPFALSDGGGTVAFISILSCPIFSSVSKLRVGALDLNSVLTLQNEI